MRSTHGSSSRWSAWPARCRAICRSLRIWLKRAFHKASTQWSEICAYDKPGTWVRRVVINAALNRKRRLAREAAAMLRLQPAVATTLPTESDSEVWDAVAKLPGKQRAAIALFYQEDRSSAEIAEILDCSESTARAHLFKARKKLAQILDESMQTPTKPTRSRRVMKGLT